MKLLKEVTLPQAIWKAVECSVDGFNSRTRESGTFLTAEAHGCKRINCTQHWQKIPQPDKRVKVVVEFDEHEVARVFAAIAARNKTGRAVELRGLIKAKVQR